MVYRNKIANAASYLNQEVHSNSSLNLKVKTRCPRYATVEIVAVEHVIVPESRSVSELIQIVAVGYFVGLTLLKLVM